MSTPTKTYADRLYCEATLLAIDSGLPCKGMKTLAGMARNPQTIAAVNRAREIVGHGNPATGKDRLQHLNVQSCKMIGAEEPTETERNAIKEVWKTMPGYSCFADALAIAARL